MPRFTDDDCSSEDGNNLEQLMENMVSEKEKLMETLRETQDELSATMAEMQELRHERDSLSRQMYSNQPQVSVFVAKVLFAVIVIV